MNHGPRRPPIGQPSRTSLGLNPPPNPPLPQRNLLPPRQLPHPRTLLAKTVVAQTIVEITSDGAAARRQIAPNGTITTTSPRSWPPVLAFGTTSRHLQLLQLLRSPHAPWKSVASPNPLARKHANQIQIVAFSIVPSVRPAFQLLPSTRLTSTTLPRARERIASVTATRTLKVRARIAHADADVAAVVDAVDPARVVTRPDATRTLVKMPIG